MTAMERASGPTPFDAIKRVDERGEFWSARDLAGLVKYSEWRNFDTAVLKARASIVESDGVYPAQDHIGDSTGMIPLGKGAFREVPDYRLTRHGADRVLMECDGRKPEVAAAKKYFTVMARVAERQLDLDDDLSAINHMILSIQATRREVRELATAQAAQGEAQRELTARVDGLESRHDWVTALGFARMNGMPTDMPFARRLGTVAGGITRQGGEEPIKVHSAVFGQVNTYPMQALREAARKLGYEVTS